MLFSPRLVPRHNRLHPRRPIRMIRSAVAKPLVLEPVKGTSPANKADGSVIFLHGLGDTGYGWQDVMNMIQRELPTVRFVLPHAPHRAVTLNMGALIPAWYDIIDLSSRARTDLAGLDETRETIESLIDNEIKKGVPSNRVIVGGFSQGGAASLYAAYQSSRPLAGVLALSCYLPAQEQFPSLINPANRSTKFLMCHGLDDEVVDPRWGKVSYDKLVQLGLPGKWIEYPGMPHAASYQEIKDVTNFIRAQLNLDGSTTSSSSSSSSPSSKL